MSSCDQDVADTRGHGANKRENAAKNIEVFALGLSSLHSDVTDCPHCIYYRFIVFIYLT